MTHNPFNDHEIDESLNPFNPPVLAALCLPDALVRLQRVMTLQKHLKAVERKLQATRKELARQLLSEGYSSQELADLISVSPSTARRMMANPDRSPRPAGRPRKGSKELS